MGAANPEPATPCPTIRAGSSARTEGLIGESLGRQVVRDEGSKKTKNSGEDDYHRRSKLAVAAAAAWLITVCPDSVFVEFLEDRSHATAPEQSVAFGVIGLTVGLQF